MSEKREEDLQNEGRGEAALDIDRMVNEGMAGGTVSSEGSAQIGHTIDLPEEEPPRNRKNK